MVNILILSDGGSEGEITSYLTAKGHEVVGETTPYYNWDGTIPPLTQVILYLHGVDYGRNLGEDADEAAASAAILAFVAAGGGLIFTEWYAEQRRRSKRFPVAALMPVTAFSYDTYHVAEWTMTEVVGPLHALFAGQVAAALVAEGFSAADLGSTPVFTTGDTVDTFSDVAAKEGAIVVMHEELGHGGRAREIPLLSYTIEHVGRVVHINDGMAFDETRWPDNNILAIINASVLFASATDGLGMGGDDAPAAANICFPAGTPVTTDQGAIAIEKLIPGTHTIKEQPIVGITRTKSSDNHLLCFEKHALEHNIPDQQTIVSREHCILYKGKMKRACTFMRYARIRKMKYTGETLYNVILEKHGSMSVNNMTVETLHPKHWVAQKILSSTFKKS